MHFIYSLRHTLLKLMLTNWNFDFCFWFLTFFFIGKILLVVWLNITFSSWTKMYHIVDIFILTSMIKTFHRLTPLFLSCLLLLGFSRTSKVSKQRFPQSSTWVIHLIWSSWFGFLSHQNIILWSLCNIFIMRRFRPCLLFWFWLNFIQF